jgi:hypothetical protein
MQIFLAVNAAVFWVRAVRETNPEKRAEFSQPNV